MRHNFVSKCPNASAVSALRPVTASEAAPRRYLDPTTATLVRTVSLRHRGLAAAANLGKCMPKIEAPVIPLIPKPDEVATGVNG